MINISVITVVRNSIKTINDCLNSVNYQSKIPYEHIIIDGLSTDGTYEEIVLNKKSYTKIFHEKDTGIYNAMNKGIRYSSGNIICFLNADDFFASNDVIEIIFKHFSSEKLDILWGDLDYIACDSNFKIARRWRTGILYSEDLKRGLIPPHPSFYVTKSAISKYNFFDETLKFAADFKLMHSLIADSSLKRKHVPKVFVKMRMGGATNASYKNIILQNIEILTYLFGIYNFIDILKFIFSKYIVRIKQSKNSE